MKASNGSRFRVSGLTVSGFRVSGFRVSGLRFFFLISFFRLQTRSQQEGHSARSVGPFTTKGLGFRV